MDPEFRHTLIFLKGLPTKIFEKKIIFHHNPIELWWFDRSTGSKFKGEYLSEFKTEFENILGC
jgi:hypothetical protein